ncbi:MAG: hypothetical protein HQL24_10325 [Candidatus Omnitrophica bacterium]|nr:hypothetical protein [Candidatus Omnitrophota bacterium]
MLTKNPLYYGLSENDEARRTLYRNFVIEERFISSRRLLDQLFIGSHEFVKRLEGYYGVNNQKKGRGRPKKEIK